MKFLILHDNGVWVCDRVVLELLVVTLGLDGLKTSQEYPLTPTCSTLQCVIRAAVYSIGPGWVGNQLTRGVDYSIGTR